MLGINRMLTIMTNVMQILLFLNILNGINVTRDTLESWQSRQMILLWLSEYMIDSIH